MQAKLFNARRGQPPGLRIDRVDIVFIALLAGLSAVLWVAVPYEGLQWLPLYLGSTFFLFCNVFRIGNRLEQLWYVPFTLVAIYCLYTLQISLLWQIVAWVLEPLKWGLIAYRIVKGPYVGVFSRLGSATPG